ncbi:MAG: hypothetical protein L0H70_00655, partial [Xanthomonadales bacterium]|nr:hypothetical protein [Xanthomonadales bacterium]
KVEETSMDLKQLRITQAPRATKIIVFVLFLIEVLVGVTCVVLTWYSSASNQAPLLQAAAYALGAGLPLLALTLLLATARTGVRAIKAQTAHFLSYGIPAELSRLELDSTDPAHRCQPFSGKSSKPAQRQTHAGCQLNLSLNPDGASAFYRLSRQTRSGQVVELWLSVDVALVQVTVCFYIESSRLEQTCSVASICKSTIEGATKSGGYQIDKEEPMTMIGGKRYCKLVARKKVEADDFLWDAAQTFFFTADLNLMVVSFMSECKAQLSRQA